MTGGFSRHVKLLAAVGLSVTLAGCEDGTGSNFDFLKKNDDNVAPISTEDVSQPVEGIEREVEKPEIFSANEPALWDGRPSLGGVWIAAPGVKDPERVLIRNLENGKSVVGALFRRERDNPGPRLQLSSDAAVELGVLAGAPTEVSVVALRTETVAPAAPVDVPEPDPEDVSDTPPTPALSTVEDTANNEATAISDPDGPSDPFVIEPEPEGSPSSLPNFFNGGAGRTGANATNGFATTVEAGRASSGAAIQTATVTTQTLDPIEAAVAALDRSDAELTETPSEQTALAVAPASSSKLAKPYVQIGIFTLQSNADQAARKLNGAGVLPVVLKQESAGRNIWRVIVGPARTQAEGLALQTKAKDLGYTDAYFVTN